jgi:hypothetical protein
LHFDRNDVEPRLAVAQASFRDIIHRDPADLLLFLMADGQLGVAIRCGTPTLDFDEDQRIPFLGHDIDLSEHTSVISFNDPITGFCEMGRSQFFTSFSSAYPRE